jgi:hypothetical protein
MSTIEIMEGVIIVITGLIFTNIITWHIGRAKSHRVVKSQVATLILEFNIVVEAIMNSNGFGERFTEELKDVRARRSLELKAKE